MNKAEAIQAMQAGSKVTHEYFSSEEWMTMQNNKVQFEDGVCCTPEEFWRERMGAGWNDGYSIVIIPTEENEKVSRS